MNEYPKIGLIYLTYPTKNWQEDISRFLFSLQNITYPKDRLELICVESKGAGPPVKAWFMKNWMPKSRRELPNINYLTSDEQLGFAANNNLGYQKARELDCDYIELTNEDTDVDSNYLLRAVEKAESDPAIGIVQSLLYMGHERNLINSLGNVFHYLGFGYSRGYLWTKERAASELLKERSSNPELNIGYASGAALLGKMSALKELESLFDEKFHSYHEDTDLSLQLKIRGWKIVLEPSSIVYHYYEFAKQKINYYWMERNRYVVILSFYKLRTLILLAPLLLIMDLLLLLFSVLRGWAGMKMKVYADWFSYDYWQWIKSRRKMIQRNRKISDRELLRTAVTAIDFQHQSVNNHVLKYLGNPILKLYWRLVEKLI